VAGNDTYTLVAPTPLSELGWNMQQLVNAVATNLTPNKGFIPSVTGVAVIRTRGDAVAVALPVVAGLQYAGDVADFNPVGSTAGQTLVILRQGGN
jgi:hypothetical protein